MTTASAIPPLRKTKRFPILPLATVGPFVLAAQTINRIGNQMKKERKHLSLSQRIIIENGLRVGKKIREIARV